LSATAVKHAFAVPEGAALSPRSTGPLPLHDKTSAILRDARDIARDVSGDSTIASDHLLLALLQRDAAIRDKLVILGLDLAQLESETASGRAPTLHLDEPLVLAEPTEQVDTARLLDASANRAREALRAIEDYRRF